MSFRDSNKKSCSWHLHSQHGESSSVKHCTKPKSTPKMASTQSGSNVTVCAAISSRHGLMHYIVLPCGMKRDMFSQFLMEVSANVIAEYGSNSDVHMLFDNAPSHRNLDDSLYSPTLPMRRIPKYSPMLNPIECAFSSLKAELKNLLSANQDNFINPDDHGRGEATYCWKQQSDYSWQVCCVGKPQRYLLC